ncbi:tRNA 2-thiouridine(34) synthase MnmA [Egibacter rhizosphaerae]|uniref:tRNA-specific 2-thiouridylase MnmA n=1 Tax=Egibacter rhizosphaerae TaxID=1670831 RepID=A0A411YCX7_9ACTN|nr:tRNA 2-thiouridine(34) synthase MnmA [Egibacter rhizosphaerae]QBI19048.1 tRNA 2-thiouridine(34) synthase MnmA [Egibacter rhizosphaerae]
MRVLVAMSGGVDSSMTAALLQDAGHNVTGVHLKLADTPSGLPGKGCCTLDDARDARRVADLLGIDFYVWDLSAAFQERVVEDFVAEYASGRTPNPCIRCNERVKYTALLERATAVGFDALATGHHVRLRHEGGRYVVRRAADRGKDQTYVLYMATQAQLGRTFWPAGEHTKDDLRAMAAERGLVTASKPDSHDICFIPSGDLAGFLRPRLGDRSGPIIGPDGTELGRHDGAYRFTIGQRRGLGISGLGEPHYVTAIDGDTVHVGPREHLAAPVIDAEQVSWVAGEAPSPAELASARLGAQVRYRGQPLACVAELDADGGLRIRFPDEVPDGVAPGQAVVLYRGDEVLGGATITGTHAELPAPALPS